MKTQHKVTMEVPFLRYLGSSSRVWGVVFQLTVLAREFVRWFSRSALKTVTQATDLSVFTGKPVSDQHFLVRSYLLHWVVRVLTVNTVSSHKTTNNETRIRNNTKCERFQTYSEKQKHQSVSKRSRTALLNGGTYCRLVLSANSLLVSWCQVRSEFLFKQLQVGSNF